MRRMAFFLVILLLVGCSSPTRVPFPKRVPGLISGFNNDDPHITLEVSGSSLTVSVDSYGNSCRSKGDTEFSVNAGTKSVQISPFDMEGGARYCSDILLTFEHSVTVELGGSGDWSVKVKGHDGTREPIEFDYTVQVD